MKRPAFLISAFSGLAAALAVWFYVSGLEARYERGGMKTPVLVALRYIEQNEPISAGDVEERHVPLEFVQPGSIRTVPDLLSPDGDKPVFTAVAPILRGEQLLGTKLAKIGGGSGLSAMVPSGKRAFALSCRGPGPGGTAAPGGRIDIIAVIDDCAITLLQNAQVLTVPGKAGGGGMAAGDPEVREDVIVAVGPYEAQILALASEKGRIYAVLRPLGDRTTSFLPVFEFGKGQLHSGRGLSGESGAFMESAKKKYDEAARMWKDYGLK